MLDPSQDIHSGSVVVAESVWRVIRYLLRPVDKLPCKYMIINNIALFIKMSLICILNIHFF